MARPSLRGAARALALALLAPAAAAQVAGVATESREPIAGGRAFGDAGAYQRLAGTVRFALDPRDPRNARIVDLQRAPRNAAGLVEAEGDLVVLQAADPGKRSGVALLEVSNRGGQAALRYFNRAGRGAPFGDGLLMRMGLTVIWIGWQFDVPRRGGRLRLRVPVVRQRDGMPLTGLVRSDWTVDRPADRLELGHRGHVPYPVFDRDSPDNVLTVRAGREAEREVVPRERWEFTADGTAIRLEGGFRAGRIYELVYRAEDPVVVGLGLAAVRDTISYAKHAPDCPFRVDRGVAVGVSQTGRFLRHFLYQGFNTDTEGRRAFDGMLILTAGAGRGSFNHRFAQPSRDAHRSSAFFYPTDLFPFTSRLQEDPVTGRMDGLLARQHDPDHVPRIFYVNTGYEYWGRAAALIHTGVDGVRDLPPTRRERIYHVAGAQHYPGRLASRRGNPIDLRAPYRALLRAMIAWVAGDREPPASRYPRLADGSLVPLAGLREPRIPGVRWPRAAHVAYRADYGPFWRHGIITRQPPELGPAFPARVPQVDALGNELGGLRTLELRVPVATYLPWSLRRDGEIADFVGRFVPLPRDAEEKRRRGDPRPHLEELYGDREGYLEKVRAACARIVAERLMLAEDVAAAVARSGRLWDLAADAPRRSGR